MEEKADQKAREEAEKGTEPPKGLITWVFQDDFIPRAKLTEGGSFSIISDYLGTPVEAYNEEGKKVWERELDIYGRVKKNQKDRFGKKTELVGEDGFIPFRYQGQYEDVETGLYYNRYRFYDPETGQYTQYDPIGLAGGNPTIYGYVGNTNLWIDPYGLYSDHKGTGMGHHLMPRSVAKKLGIFGLSGKKAIAWYPDISEGTAGLHKQLHRSLIDEGIPYQGSKFTGSLDDFWNQAAKAYDGIDTVGYLKIPGTKKKLFKGSYTPGEALEKIKELQTERRIQKGKISKGDFSC